jgi:hypothetical protein
MANMVEAVALMKKLSGADRARAFKVGQQQRELLEAQEQAAAMSAKADALKHALAVSEAEHARREYASTIGMASPTRLLKSSRLLHSPGSGNPSARKKHASRTSPSRQEAQSRFGGPTEDSTAVMLDFDAGASVCAGNALLLNDIKATANGDFDPYLADDIGNASDGGSEMAHGCYGWIPHNAGFGFLDRPRGVLGQIHFLDRF